MAPASAAESVSLAAGLALALRQLRANAPDAARYNVRIVGKERGMILLFLLSSASFAWLTNAEARELKRERRVAAKAVAPAAKAPAGAALLPAAAAGAGDATVSAAQAKQLAKAKRSKKGLSFWSELRYVLAIAFPKGVLSRGGALASVQMGLLVMRTLITVRATQANTFLLTRAIARGSWPYWSRWVFNFLCWAGSATVVNTGLRYVESTIALELRENLTRAAHARYLKDNAFYRSAVMKSAGMDQADQRICADIAAFSREAATLYGHSFKPILEFALSLSAAAGELGFSRPTALFASQVIITMALRSIAPPLGKMIAREAELEGRFRAAHSRLIVHAEEVAFLKGGDTERGILNTRLKALISTQRFHALQRTLRSLSENIGKFQGLLVGGAFVHIPFLIRASATEGDRISSFRATEELMLRCGGAFTEVLFLGKSIDELAGHTQRISTLFRALDAPVPSSATPEVSDVIAFRGVTVCAPEPGGEPRVLVRHLNLEVAPGKNLIVTGPNGSGKTSCFRVLAGLWQPAEGALACPKSGIMWLPQSPFLVSGSLRDQVTYPTLAGFQRRFDSRVTECLTAAGLSKLAANPLGLDLAHEEWDDVLSGGERQRIGFARLFYHAPRFAIMDEATSAINPDEECKLYSKLVEAGITCISIAHRLELRRFHQQELVLKGDGTGAWELRELAAAAAVAK